MEAEKVIQDLTRRFAAPLPEFYKRRVIFWYDEDQEFLDQIDSITIPDVKLLKLTGSNSFAAKKTLVADDPYSDYLVYCPLRYERSEDNWLRNIELYSGEIFRADLNTVWMDEMGLNPSPVLHRLVKQYNRFFGSKERRAKFSQFAPGITTQPQMHLAVMASICGCKDTQHASIIRAVLMAGLYTKDNPLLSKLHSYGADQAFWALVAQATGYQNSDQENLGAMAAHIFLTALSRTLRREDMIGLESLISTPHQAFCFEFVSGWLMSQDFPAIRSVAEYVEEETGLYQRFMQLELDEIMQVDCFPCVDEVILRRLMTEIHNQLIQIDLIRKAVERRQTAPWYAEKEVYYEGLRQVANMQEFYLNHASGFHTVLPAEIWKEYTSEYYKMDTYYRLFHRSFIRSLKLSGGPLDDLSKQVADQVEGLYNHWFLGQLGQTWSDMAADELQELGGIEGVPRQERFYDRRVGSSKDRVFVIISDALRYEVAATLAEELRQETQCTVELDSMCGIFPTITPFGMAALLPHKHLTLQKRDNGSLSVLADGQPTDSIYREKVLKAANSKSVALQYKNIIGMTRTERSDLVKGAEVVYIYHDRIDEASHTSDLDVFPACDSAIEEIKNLVRIIVNNFGGTRILITADHGFLYTYSPLTEDDKVGKESWNGKDVSYGRRYAIMEQGSEPDYLMPVKLLEGDTGFDAFAPRESIRIKMSGGGMNFVHGGASLQELVVPVVDYHFLRNANKTYQKNRKDIDTKPVNLSLLSSVHRISNLYFALTFYQEEAVGGNREKASYSLYFTDSAGKTVSDTVKIIADKQSPIAQERTFRCNFSLKSIQFDSKETYYLIISRDGSTDMPQRIEFQIDIAFAVDEFNFFG